MGNKPGSVLPGKNAGQYPSDGLIYSAQRYNFFSENNKAKRQALHFLTCKGLPFFISII
jgi:hypothetical protein